MMSPTVEIPAFVTLTVDQLTPWLLAPPAPDPRAHAVAVRAPGTAKDEAIRTLFQKPISRRPTRSAALRLALAGLAVACLAHSHVPRESLFSWPATARLGADISNGLPAVSSPRPSADNSAPVLGADSVDSRADLAHWSLAAVADRHRHAAQFLERRYRISAINASEYVRHAVEAAADFRLDWTLVLAVMATESSFNPVATSSAGAQGLMQVHTKVHLEKFRPYGGARSVLDPRANIRVGAEILRDYILARGSIHDALKSYVGAALMPDDGGYAQRVLSERLRLVSAYSSDPLRRK